MSTGIVVTGLGIVSPFGTSQDAFRDALLAGRNGMAPVTAFDTSTCRAHCAALVADFDPSRWIHPMKQRRMDAAGQYAVALARQALDDAGVVYGETPDDGVGIVLGTYTAGGQPTEDFLRGLFAAGPNGAPALIFNATVANIAASLAGLEMKLRGPNATISQKEASGLSAIAHAADILRHGRARALIAGGVDAVYHVFYRVHDRFGALSHANGHPEGSRPFDATRNGMVLGEGGYVLVLEDEAGAAARGARIHGHLLGSAAGGTSVGLYQWPERPEPLVRIMNDALARAQVRPDQVDVVYAAANSSALDAVEAKALHSLFGGGRAVVTSIKGALGESGAAGAGSCVAALLCGRSGVVPPVAGLMRIDPACEGLRIARSAEPAPGPIVLINSVASGGALMSAVLRVAD
ncbi:MAG: beta-ketoacyl synthase N-terminal-like domain-containing protein [Acidobacteriota bacterium]